MLAACVAAALVGGVASANGNAKPSILPPGSAVSPEPSDEIFPAQSMPLRFSHERHVKRLALTCKVCHDAAWTSDAASDRLLPRPTTCDACHDVDHGDLSRVRAGKEPSGQCGACHVGGATGNRVARVVMPTPNLRFSHVKHVARNIGCGQCHGRVAEVDLATRAQLPRMAGCLACHGMAGPARGDAKGTCATCHLTEPDGRLRTAFGTGSLVPPPWMRGAAHDADWSERHKVVAGADSSFCGSCHTSKECADCHDGRVRPRKVHPNDWLSMHPQAARQDNPRCSSCHQEAVFCGDCHRRTGVARDAPSGNRLPGRRFHLPPEVWTNAPRGPQHHAWDAMRNLNACVSCHTERDCTTCHATRGRGGGMGVSPHPVGFRDKCALALRRNPRPCLACHTSGDRSLGMCR